MWFSLPPRGRGSKPNKEDICKRFDNRLRCSYLRATFEGGN
ncbi:hypothetical protein RMSM_02944 [Rhodopirellula maiorica SM1]|uniref:Uncharacterized protein n=1 Tax=Rhodopirellula maiorica SM1 TaxID=1265738 RepID=M5RLE1_9BACT|nr:hypothetical protein RMSM_02944 [Rhodopirellula maiorica SM1]